MAGVETSARMVHPSRRPSEQNGVRFTSRALNALCAADALAGHQRSGVFSPRSSHERGRGRVLVAAEDANGFPRLHPGEWLRPDAFARRAPGFLEKLREQATLHAARRGSRKSGPGSPHSWTRAKKPDRRSDGHGPGSVRCSDDSVVCRNWRQANVGK